MDAQEDQDRRNAEAEEQLLEERHRREGETLERHRILAVQYQREWEAFAASMRAGDERIYGAIR